jgi:serine/threonine protein kinase
MSSEKAIDLLNQALEIQDPVERSGFLKGACTDDPELLAHVQKLLAAHAAAGDAFPTDPGAEATILDPTAPGEGPGSQIGKYKLLQVIGEGGMGVVYLAAEEGAIHRKVAFKIIKLGMDTKSVVARFEAERQALALMDHRNIAKVFDAGATDTGRPFFVMELVKGIPITEYCDKHQLTVEQRLELFIPVCEAIQHAHHKGIIHRDIKPSNVLVAHFDGKPVPMVIDFGIAKATHQRLTEKTQWTEFGQFIGTPAYVSPEQAEGSQLDIDTRSDIYSLGVLLYELLTGSTPFPDKRLRSAGWKEMQRIILEDPPDRPSTRLSTLTQQERTKWTKVHPEGLGRISLLLRRELDWVVMKCLEKDRSRRYETANGLAMDLGRYLKGEPTIAVPPTRGYVLGKLVRKHRKTFALAAAIAVILAGATVISTWQMIVAKRERAIATAVSDFLDKDLLQRADVYGSDPFTTPHRDLKLLEVVNRASTNLTGKFDKQPVVEATIRLTLGKIYIGLGELLVAEEHLERSLELFERTLGDNDLRTAEAAHNLGRIQTIRFHADAAEKNLQHAIQLRSQISGRQHPSVLETRLDYASLIHRRGESVRGSELVRSLYQDSTQYLEPDNPLALKIAEAYAWELWDSGKGHEGIKLLEQIHEKLISRFGSNNVRVLANDHSRAWLAMAFERNQKKADDLWADIYRRGAETLGNAPETIEAMGRMGLALRDQGLSTRGRGLLKKSNEVSESQVPPDHPFVYSGKMFEVFSENAYYTADEYVRKAEEVLDGYKRYGQHPPNYGSIWPHIHRAHWRAGNRDGVLETAREALAHQHRILSTNSVWYYNPIRELTWWLARMGRWDESAQQRSSILPLPLRNPNDLLEAAVMLAIAGRTNEAATAMRERLKDFAVTNITGLDATWVSAFVLNEMPAAISAALLSQPLPASPSAPELLAHGLAHLRTGDAARAAELLRPVVEHSPNPHLAILAGHYLSLALKETGDTAQASRVLETANARLERVLRCGDTGESQWLWAALCLVARNEAELVVLGAIRSTPVDGAYITRMREQWKRVHELLEAGLQHCRHSRWPAARAAFLEAIRHPAFSWEAGEVAVANLRFLVALAFNRAGDDANYRDLCDSPPPDAFLAPLNHLTVSLDFQKSADRVLVYDYSKMFQPADNMGGPEWREALSAFADYAADRELETVLATFGAAAEKCYHWGRQTVGLAMGAATLAKLKRDAEAAEWLARAEAKWQELDENNQPDRAWHWPELTLCELALDEARRQIDEGTVTGR